MMAYNSTRRQNHIFNFNLPDVRPLLHALIIGDYTRVPRPRISRQFVSMIRRQKYRLSKSLMNFLLGSKSSFLVICQGQKLWQRSPRKNRKNTHRTPRNKVFERFREGAALHLFLIFTRLEIKINGLISDRCRSLFSSRAVNGTYQTQFVELCKEHRKLESINNLQFKLAEFACSNSLAFSRQNADSS